MPDRLLRGDYRFLAICLLLLAGTVWFSARYFQRAFPEASIDFRVTREHARAQAESFLAGQGLHVDGYRAASRFSYDDTAKTFLERELGLDRANRLMGSRVRLWRWSWRWFRPLQKEEFRVDVTPAGELAGFEHEIAEAAARPSLPADQARAVAERFLREAMHRDPAGLDFVEGSSVTRPARTDHTFTWKERDFEGLVGHDATYRLEVTVLGSEAGGYREYLKVPETWQRSYETLRSRNATASVVDAGFMMLLAVGLLVTIVLRVRGHDIRWQLAAAVGGTGALLYFLANWNAQPLAEFGYPTTDSYASFVAQELLRNLTGALGAGGLLFVLTAGAEPVYRERYRARMPLSTLFSWRGLGSKQFFLGTILGITLAGIFVAYQTGFYMVAYRLGAWSPADVPYDDLLNTRLPWLYVLFGGFLPAVSEEFMFRMFAIPFLSKLLRYVPIAVVLAAFIWGFGHAGYPQQPYWIRGVEVGIGGVALGLIMLRWGILPTLVWHYSVDAMYTALLLLRSHNPYFVFSGAASAGIMVLPVLVAGIAYLRRGGFVPEAARAPDEPVEAPAEAPEVPAAPAEGLPYTPWPRRRRLAVAAAIVAGVAIAAAVRTREFGDEPRFALSATQARAAAGQFARTQGFDSQGYRSVATPTTNWDDSDTRLAAKYLVERRDIAYVADAFHRQVPLHGWTVRYFKPLQREEARVSMDPESGRVFEFEHILPEDQPGADLSADAARDLVLHALSQVGGVPSLAGFELKESTSEKKKARRDYTLVWEARAGDPRNVDEARFRVRVKVAGDRVTSFSSYWKVPEAFERVRERRNALSYMLLVLRIAVSAGLVVLGIWLLIERTRQGALRWGQALRTALPLGAITLVGMGMTAPLLLGQYPTTFSLETFAVTLGVSLFIGALALFIALACGVALILGLEPGALAVFRRANRKVWGTDALLATGLAAAAVAALGRLRWLEIDRFHPQALLSADAQTAFATISPAASGIAAACQQALSWLAILALVAYLVRYLGRWPGAAVLAGLAAAAGLAPGTVHTGGEFLLYYGMRVMYLAAAAIFVKYVAGRNYLAYLLIVWTLALMDKSGDLLSQPATPLRVQGGILIAVLAGTVAWVIAPVVRDRGGTR